MSLGARLRAARHGAKLTLAAVGNACGVTPQAVKKWEKDESPPPVAAVLIIVYQQMN